MTASPQQMSPPTAGRATPASGADLGGAAYAERLWAALCHARAGHAPQGRAYTEDAVFRF
jgi:hypothetical protein